MTEGPPKIPPIESNPSTIDKERLVELLRANQEDLSPLNAYLNKREAEVISSKDALALNIEVAEIKRDAGNTEGAREAFTDAAEHAWQENEDERYAYCISELNKLNT